MLILLINLFVLGFIIITIIKCAKDKIRPKALFIILIICSLYFGATIVDGDVILSFGFWIGFRFSSTTILFPAGAIIYWCIRKKRILKTALSNATPTPAQECETNSGSLTPQDIETQNKEEPDNRNC